MQNISKLYRGIAFQSDVIWLFVHAALQVPHTNIAVLPAHTISIGIINSTYSSSLLDGVWTQIIGSASQQATKWAIPGPRFTKLYYHSFLY